MARAKWLTHIECQLKFYTQKGYISFVQFNPS